MGGHLVIHLVWALVTGCLRRTLVNVCLEEWETHPQEKNDDAHQGEWYMEVDKAITQITVCTAKWLTERLIRRLGGWLITQCSSAFHLVL